MMRTVEVLSRLAGHQDAIQHQIADMERLAAAGPDHAHELGRMRWELTRMLRAYQLFKHGEIFDPAIASGNLADVSLARLLKSRCLLAAAAFRRYTLEWGSRDIVGEWDEYVVAFHGMARTLRTHLAFERRNIGRALALIEDTRRRA